MELQTHSDKLVESGFFGRRRFGRLAVLEGTGSQVRCECASCGAHLLATPNTHGVLQGVCLVCGAEDFDPVK